MTKKNNVAQSTPQPSRRSFLGRSAASAAATIAIPTFLPDLCRADGRAMPNDRLTIGVIGCGKMAKDNHIPILLRQTDTQIVAVCEVDQTRLDKSEERINKHYSKANRKFKGVDAYKDFRKIIERDDIDAVLIATPENWHCIQLVEACKSGKDVFCEKPLTLSIAESKLCIDATRKYKRIVQTGSQQRSNVFGKFREAAEIIRNGWLGKIHKVTVGVGDPPIDCDLGTEKMEPGLDWDLWLGPAPKRGYHSILSPRGVHNHFPQWRRYREYAGGGHADMGAHHYDIANWALGLDESGPVKIVPPNDPKSKRGVKFVYENGLEIIHGGPGGCVFHGEKGKLRIDRGHLSSDPAEIAKLRPSRKDHIRLAVSKGHHRDWLDCIKSRKAPVAEVEKGARTAAQIHLGNLAYQFRREFQWDPHKWTFKSEKDNELLDRERRDPWQLPKLD